MHVEKQIGKGQEAVYAFHYPSQTKRFGPYLLKIGMSRGDPVKRILSLKSAMQEEPVVDLIIWCDDATTLERAIHNKLKEHRRGRTEWFMTTPEDIETAWIWFNQFDDLPLGEQIRTLRRQKGMTQQQLANLARVRQATISKVENGNGEIQLSTLEAIVTELHLRLVLIA